EAIAKPTSSIPQARTWDLFSREAMKPGSWSGSISLRLTASGNGTRCRATQQAVAPDRDREGFRFAAEVVARPPLSSLPSVVAAARCNLTGACTAGERQGRWADSMDKLTGTASNTSAGRLA